MKPTIISQIMEKSANSDNVTLQENKVHPIKQIIRPEVSEEMRNALYSVVNTNNQYKNARVI
jgi:cell division protein FtsI/penicillin-binding protein 2